MKYDGKKMGFFLPSVLMGMVTTQVAILPFPGLPSCSYLYEFPHAIQIQVENKLNLPGQGFECRVTWDT